MITSVAIDKTNTKESFSGKISKLMNARFFHKIGIYGKSELPTSDRFCYDESHLLHTVDDKKADKWIDDIRWTVMVFDAILVREDIL